MLEPIELRHILRLFPPHGAPIDIPYQPGEAIKVQGLVFQDGEVILDGEIKTQECVVEKRENTIHCMAKGKIHL